MNHVLYAATKLLDRFSVIPLSAGNKTPIKGFDLKTYQRTRRATPAEIIAWFQGEPLPNIGIVTGKMSGMFVLDCDTEEAYQDVAARGLPVTMTVKTARGYHLYFAYPDGLAIGNRTGLLPGCDIRGDGGYVVAPPSLHPSGIHYKWIHDVAPAAAPGWLLDLLTMKERRAALPKGKGGRAGEEVRDPAAYIAAAFDREINTLINAQEGERNNTLNTAAFNLGQLVPSGMIREFDVFKALEGAALAIGLGEAEITATIKSGIESGKATPRKLAFSQDKSPTPDKQPSLDETMNLTDLGNARRMVKLYGERLRYVNAYGQWYVWDGTRWGKDETGGIMRAAKKTVMSMYGEASDITDDKERRALVKHALNSESRSRLENMISLCKTEKTIAVKPDALDGNHWLLNCRNMTIDLRTGQAAAHDPKNLISRRLEVDYDPRATCATWVKFLRVVMAGDDDMIEFLQRAVGYTLTGDVGEQSLFFMIGTGKNGKSTFIETLISLMGEYTVKTPTETLMNREGKGVPNDVARLKGMRMVVARETEEGQRLAEAVIKDLTGGDRIVARFLHQEFFEFTPTHKLWMYGNHKPLVKGTDEGIWRRIRLIPFTVTIPPEGRDPNLTEKLRAELPGILNWALDGCRKWQAHGLNDPKRIREATADYRSEMDVLAEFIRESCELSPNAVATAHALYKQYSSWCEDVGERAMSKRQLGLRLQERGFKPHKGTTGTRTWLGIGLPLAKK